GPFRASGLEAPARDELQNRQQQRGANEGDDDAAPEAHGAARTEDAAEEEASDDGAGHSDHDVGDAAKATAGDHAGGDGAGNQADDDPSDPRAGVEVEMRREDGGGVGGHVFWLVWTQLAMMSKTSSLPRSLKGSWYRPSSMRRSLTLGVRACSSSLPWGSIRRSAVPARMRKGSVISAAR